MTANFLFVSDDKYVKNLGICTCSVIENMCDVVEKLRLFVMDCGINGENKARLQKQALKYDNVELVFYNINEKLHEVAPKVKTKWHPAIYGRLFLVDVLDQYDDIDRIIYLDCDLLMARPVPELLTMDLRGKCLAGVADTAAKARKEALHIPQEYTYINSGVLVIDAAKWVALDASRRIVEFINSFPEAFLYPDQDAINSILYDEILTLPPQYNVMWMMCDRDIPKMKIYIEDFPYSEEELSYALHQGRIYHFAGHDMWTFYGITPIHAKVFEKYRKLCDWRKEKRHFESPYKMLLWLLVSAKSILMGEWPFSHAE